MPDINLLPSQMKPKDYVVNLAKSLKKIAIVSLVVFLVASIASAGVYFYFFRRAQSSLAEQARLKNEIAALQSTEQRLVLVKDRLAKIGEVYETDDAEEEISAFERVSSLATGEISVNEVEIQKNTIIIFLTATSLSELSSFTANLVRVGGFQKIVLNSMTFDPEEGYVVSLSVN